MVLKKFIPAFFLLLFLSCASIGGYYSYRVEESYPSSVTRPEGKVIYYPYYYPPFSVWWDWWFFYPPYPEVIIIEPPPTPRRRRPLR